MEEKKVEKKHFKTNKNKIFSIYTCKYTQKNKLQMVLIDWSFKCDSGWQESFPVWLSGAAWTSQSPVPDQAVMDRM